MPHSTRSTRQDPGFDPARLADDGVTVIIPTLNEAGNIGPLLDRLFNLESLRGRLEVIVADDHSTDGTLEEVRARQCLHPVSVSQRRPPPDLAASVLEAARLARGRWCVVMDADGSHPAEAISRLLEPLEAGSADVVVGSRHIAGGGISNWPAWRRTVSRAAALLAWPFTRVRDPMSGFFATRTELLAALEPTQAGYKVLLELLVRTQPEPSVVEVPFIFNDRDKGDSKMSARVQWLFVRRLAALGGARMTLGNLSRFGLVGLSGVAVDLLVFWWMQSLGASLATAHCTSFLVATVSNFALNYRWTFARAFDTDQALSRRYGAFLMVALLALVLRGGVFAWLTGGLEIGAGVAILPAVAMTAIVNYLGSIFYVFPARGGKSRPEIRWRMAALGLISCSLLLRWLYLGQAELIFDEMYYWTYTLHPALSYLDHPPLTAWLIALGTALAGDNAFGVRLPTLLLGPLSLVFAYFYARDLLDKTRGLIAAMLVAVVPAWFAGGFLMTTDAAVVAAWLAALYFLQRALLQRDAWAWLGVGASIGIGALSKYTIVFLAPAILVFILLHKPSRSWLIRWQPWAGAVISLAIFSPVLIWNARHDWASFTFQSTRRIVEDPGFNSHWVLIHGIVMLAPLAGLAAIYLLGPVRHRLCPQPDARRFMLTMTLVPLSIILFFAAMTETRYHWVVPVWLALLPLLAASVFPPRTRAGNDELQEEKPLIWLQKLWKPVLPLSLVLIGLGLHYVSLGLPGLGWQEHRLGYMGWPEIAHSVHELELEIEQATGRRPIVAGMAKWGISSALAFHDVDERRDNITARNLVGMSGSQWERWFDRDSDPSRPVLLVSHEPKLIDESWLELALVGLGPLQSRPVYRDGRVIQRLYFRVGRGFRPEMLRYPGHIP